MPVWTTLMKVAPMFLVYPSILVEFQLHVVTGATRSVDWWVSRPRCHFYHHQNRCCWPDVALLSPTVEWSPHCCTCPPCVSQIDEILSRNLGFYLKKKGRKKNPYCTAIFSQFNKRFLNILNVGAAPTHTYFLKYTTLVWLIIIMLFHFYPFSIPELLFVSN